MGFPKNKLNDFALVDKDGNIVEKFRLKGTACNWRGKMQKRLDKKLEVKYIGDPHNLKNRDREVVTT